MNPKHKTPTRPLYISAITWLGLVPLICLAALSISAQAFADFFGCAEDALAKKLLALREVRV